MTTPSPETLAQALADLLKVEQIGPDTYLGKRLAGGTGRVFGGQAIAQALQAAQRSTDAPKVAHSLHAYFMRPGSEDHPIIFSVTRDFDGRSFATRRVTAMQLEQPILTLTASFQTPEPGLHHQATMPDVPPPEVLQSEHALRLAAIDAIPERFRAFALRGRPIEIRPVEPRSWIKAEPRSPHQASWFRLCAPIEDAAEMHRAILSYASDMLLLGTCTLPHGVHWMTPELQTASVDHALWLHEEVRVDEWLLYATDSPWAGHARGFNRGQIFTRDGRLVASVAQEGLIRMHAATANRASS